MSTDTARTAEPPVATPRLAATLLLLRAAPLEVLMVRRNSKGSFASALVFPGGVHSHEDAHDDWADLIEWSGEFDSECQIRITALRETFEETGILPLAGDDGDITAAASRGEDRAFIEIVRDCGGKLPLDRMVHFAHWITPEALPKRFDTHFYLLSAPAACDHARSDGEETVSIEWREAAHVLDQEPGLPFATKLNLLRLQESESLTHALDASRARPRFTVLPRLVENGTFLEIPVEAGYGITREARGTMSMPR